jgi:chemotaxis protein MotB
MKRRRPEEHDNTDRWVVSYADFITLLFAFFTTMYAISQVDTAKLRMFAGSMKSAFRSADSSVQKPVIEGIVPVSPEAASIERMARESILPLNAGNDIEVSRDERGVVVSIGDNLLFEAGKAELKKEALPSISAVASMLKKLPNRAIIEGHTDNLPVSAPSSRFASNWELSTHRATTVLSHLIKEHNLPPERFSAAGYAEYRPRDTNNTPEGRAKNRRVDIVVLGSR